MGANVIQVICSRLNVCGFWKEIRNHCAVTIPLQKQEISENRDVFTNKR